MKKIFISSLGCDKNLVDTEHFMALLADAGYEFTDTETEADIGIVNTCSFIGDAKKESIDEIFRLAGYKKNGRMKYLFVTGCLAERYQKEFESAFPEVDGAIGTGNLCDLPDIIKKAGRKKIFSYRDDGKTMLLEKRIRSGPYSYSFLKIAEGCDKNCTYCAIPGIRGHYRSVPMEILLSEAEALAKSDVTELILVAQETTLYGVDLYGKKTLPELLRKLSKIKELHWIRLLYCYPEEITDELLLTVRRIKKIVPYFDLPVQHASDVILKRMNRRTTGKELAEKIGRIREILPDVTLRTTCMTGFPGETESDYRALLRFIKKIKFDHLGVFSYSKEEGTPASRFDHPVPKKISEARKAEILKVQHSISEKLLKEKVGSVLEVITDGYLPEENVYIGRTQGDAPEVDSSVFFTSESEILSGTFCKVRITAAEAYDLFGERI